MHEFIINEIRCHAWNASFEPDSLENISDVMKQNRKYVTYHFFCYTPPENIGRVVPEIGSWTDKHIDTHTDRQTDTLITILLWAE